MSALYPPFSGEGATCPKCGGSMGTRYQRAGTVFVSQDLMRCGGGTDWLLRECLECDFRQPEMCRDAYPETAIPHGHRGGLDG